MLKRIHRPGIVQQNHPTEYGVTTAGASVVK
jgi:hypothetical protein